VYACACARMRVHVYRQHHGETHRHVQLPHQQLAITSCVSIHHEHSSGCTNVALLCVVLYKVLMPTQETNAQLHGNIVTFSTCHTMHVATHPHATLLQHAHIVPLSIKGHWRESPLKLAKTLPLHISTRWLAGTISVHMARSAPICLSLHSGGWLEFVAKARRKSLQACKLSTPPFVPYTHLSTTPSVVRVSPARAAVKRAYEGCCAEHAVPANHTVALGGGCSPLMGHTPQAAATKRNLNVCIHSPFDVPPTLSLAPRFLLASLPALTLRCLGSDMLGSERAASRSLSAVVAGGQEAKCLVLLIDHLRNVNQNSIFAIQRCKVLVRKKNKKPPPSDFHTHSLRFLISGVVHAPVSMALHALLWVLNLELAPLF
jgi:hypothetical protein